MYNFWEHILFFFICLCLSLCVFVHHLLELVLQVALSGWMWVLKTEPRSSIIAARSLNS